MSIELHTDGGKMIDLEVRGQLTGDDYDRMVPELEQMIQAQGRINLLLEMHDFHGWTPRGMWKDLRFGLAHRKDFDRIALAGEARWQRWMSAMAGWFTPAEVRYFDASQSEEARRWLQAA